MITFAIFSFFFGVVISAAAVLGATMAKSAVHIFKRASRKWIKGIQAGLSAGKVVQRDARPSFANDLMRTGALKRVA